ncbi:hypothetical protein IC607_04525 [Cellulomonas sp. JH27-2]|uniref:nidogen-like domain-containing protein n=1 Tax=Cellulomonas sp. JH27-2 TaxID=2774139 RepID=UPI00178431B5|nr:nidogen-like domain-containing protein [Cellulomonas sp. JH27-2]MBD8058234.1 hypothetical protein [Cellulomonas sp. JH27-2]
MSVLRMRSASSSARTLLAMMAGLALVAGMTTATSTAASAAAGAVVESAGCRQHTLAPNDDGSTGIVPLPFRINFYGIAYDSLYVNNNGNVTFSSALGTYTPFGLVGNHLPMIAPFFADVDTNGGAGAVSYGATTYEGRSAFCVLWPGVGYFPNQIDKLNTFQLLLVQRSDRGNADFDIVFNYDSIQWETGSASGGSGGFGGSSARAGFSSGLDGPGKSYELPGSGVNSALLDGGPESLAGHSQGSTVDGRYVYAIKNGSPNYILREPDELYGVRAGSFYVSDPINTATGNLVLPETDLASVGGATGLGLGRTYNSVDTRVGSFGAGWSTSLDVAVTEVEGGQVELRDADGRAVPFRATGTGWSRPEEFPGTLGRSPQGYSVAFDDGSAWTFDVEGRLATTSDSDGTVTELRRDAAGAVTSLVRGTGPSILLERDQAGRVTRATASDGRVVSYAYVGANLVSFTDPAGGIRAYRYDDADRLAAEQGPDGRVTMTNTFDGAGRVITQSTVGADVSFEYDDIAGMTTIHDARTGETTVVRHDTAGHPVAVVDSTGHSIARTFDAAGNLVSSTDRGQATTSATYDDSGNVLSATDALGGVVTWGYDDAERVIAITDEAGRRTTYEYEGDERTPSTITSPTGAVTRSVVVDGLVRSTTDADGVVTRFSYDAQGNLIATTDGVGARTTYDRDDEGRISRVTTPAGRVTAFEYDALGRVIAESDGAGTKRSSFDSVGRVLSTTDAAGGVTTYRYDAAGNLVRVTDPVGETTVSGYDEAGRLVTSTSPAGGSTSYSYGALGRIMSVTSPTGGRTAYTYDALGHVASVTDPLGRTTRQAVDALGRVTSTTDGAGRTTTYEYDAVGNTTAMTDPAGARTTVTYDGEDRALSVTAPGRGTTHSEWTAAGRLAVSVDATGVATRYGYDAAGRQVSVTDALGGVSRTVYDADGLMVSQTSAAGRTTAYGYDAAGRLERTTHAGRSETQVLDATGRVVAATTAGGARTTHTYDRAGHLTSSTDPLGATTSYSWEHGLLAATTDAVGKAERRTYDADGRVAAITDRGGAVTTFGYDAAGQLTSVTQPSGRTEARSYDAAGNPTARNYGDGSGVRYTYDVRGTRTSMVDGRGTTTYRLDAAGRVVQSDGPDGSQGATFDAAGRQTAVRYPDGSTLTKSYDAAGRLVAQSHPVWGAVSWTLDPDGLVLRESLPSKQSRSYTYDVDGRAASVAQTVSGGSSSVTIGRDKDGRVVSTRTIGGLSAGSAAYTYDAAGQLVAARTTDLDPLTPTKQAWTYDSTGSRTSATADGVTSSYRYDEAHRLSRTTTLGLTTTFGYDADGRRTSERSSVGSVVYGYDAAGRLSATTASVGSLVTSTQDRTYDGDGQVVGYRVTRGRQTTSTAVSWDLGTGAPQVLATRTGSRTYDVVTSPGGPLGMTRQNGTSAVFAKDGLGSITTTLATADLVSASAYDAFGQADLDVSVADLTLTPTLGYRGSLTLGDDVALTVRTFDPRTGQFLSTDPIDQPGGAAASTNEYAYAANDPVDRVDPLGLSPISDGGVNGLDLSTSAALGTPSNPDVLEYSLQHFTVQLHFIFDVLPGTAMEVAIPGSGPNGGLGYADLVAGRLIWEVKTASKRGSATGRAETAAQLDRYIANRTGSWYGHTYSEYTIPHGPGELVVKSYGDPGMLWYYYRASVRPIPVPVPVPVRAPQTAPEPLPVVPHAEPIPHPQPGPAPVPPPPGGYPGGQGWQVPGWVTSTGEAVVVVGGVILVGAWLVVTFPLQAATA